MMEKKYTKHSGKIKKKVTILKIVHDDLNKLN